MKSLPPVGPGAVRVFAPASVANFGVGFDVLGAALDGPGDRVTACASRHEGIRVVSITGDRGRLSSDPTLNTCAVAAAAILSNAPRNQSRPKGIDLWLEKGLPLASGLGSSAASAAAGALAAATLLGMKSPRKLLAAVLRGEHAADGAWHGDNAFASLLGGLLLVLSSDPRRPEAPISLPVPDHLRLVLVHPEFELSTRSSRAVLPESVSLGRHVRGAAALAALVHALHRGDLPSLGRWASADEIVEPARAPLIPGYESVTSAMRDAGAFGWALAGAGPSLVAFSEAGARPHAIGRAAVKAFRSLGVAATARTHRVDPRGARVETPG